jgi:hypothetical protein
MPEGKALITNADRRFDALTAESDRRTMEKADERAKQLRDSPG